MELYPRPNIEYKPEWEEIVHNFLKENNPSIDELCAISYYALIRRTKANVEILKINNYRSNSDTRELASEISKLDQIEADIARKSEKPNYPKSILVPAQNLYNSLVIKLSGALPPLYYKGFDPLIFRYRDELVKRDAGDVILKAILTERTRN